MASTEIPESASPLQPPATNSALLSIEGGAVRLDRCDLQSHGCVVDVFAGASLLARGCCFDAHPLQPLERQPAATTCELPQAFIAMPSRKLRVRTAPVTRGCRPPLPVSTLPFPPAPVSTALCCNRYPPARSVAPLWQAGAPRSSVQVGSFRCPAPVHAHELRAR
jgi:hypothetical protein